MTPSSAYPKQRPNHATPLTTFVAFAERDRCCLIARGEVCFSVLVIYPGRRQRPGPDDTILSRMLNASSRSGVKRCRERAIEQEGASLPGSAPRTAVSSSPSHGALAVARAAARCERGTQGQAVMPPFFGPGLCDSHGCLSAVCCCFLPVRSGAAGCAR